jgi:meso-butanediol dehydrogenase / (S,S)-butanediol dehydrogenase / diacetyl reductase
MSFFLSGEEFLKRSRLTSFLSPLFLIRLYLLLSSWFIQSFNSMSRSRFTDKVVFITGGTSGLGLATTKLFIAEGAKVFVTDLTERSVIESLKSKDAVFKRRDVGDPEDCETAIKACIERFGRLDVLFHCAAQSAHVNPVPKQMIADFQKVVNINLSSAFYLARVAIPQMQKQGKGAIVNIASTSGLAADYGLCSYNAAKAGVINLTRAMAIDHAREGIEAIGANTVCPGYMITPMTQGFRDNQDLHGDLVEGIPGRGCDPAEVGQAVLFLASDEASYCNGTGKQSRLFLKFPR